MTKRIAIALALAACGAKQPAGGTGGTGTGSDAGQGPVRDTRTELEKRRDAACKTIAPKLTSCALEDAKADLAAGVVKKADFDRDTAPDVLRKHTDKFIDECTARRDMSSRQVRVLEVCFHEEQQCGPLRDCLGYLEPKPNQPNQK